MHILVLVYVSMGRGEKACFVERAKEVSLSPLCKFFVVSFH